MNGGRWAIGGALAVWLSFQALAADATVLEKRSLSIPVNLTLTAGKPATPGECLVSAGPAIPISALAFSPDGKMLLAGGYQEVVAWDMQTGKLARRLGAGPVGQVPDLPSGRSDWAGRGPAPLQLTGQVRALAFTKDGKTLAVAEGTAGSAGAVRLIDVAGGQVSATLEQTKDEMLSLALSPDGKFLVAGGTDALVRIWTMSDRKPLAPLKKHSDWISGIAFSPDSKLMATASADRTVQVWEAGTWKPVVELPQTVTEPVSGVAFSPDGQFLVFAVGGSDERAIRFWRTDSIVEPPGETDTAKARRIQNLKLTRPYDTGAGLPLNVVWPPPSPSKFARMFIPATDKTVKVMAANGGIAATLTGHTDWVYSVAVSPDGTRVASGSADGSVRLWNGVDNTPLAVLLQLSPRSDQWVAVSPRGFFAASKTDALQWKAVDPKVTLPTDLTSRLESPEIVGQLLQGKPVPATLPIPKKK